MIKTPEYTIGDFYYISIQGIQDTQENDIDYRLIGKLTHLDKEYDSLKFQTMINQGKNYNYIITMSYYNLCENLDNGNDVLITIQSANRDENPEYYL